MDEETNTLPGPSDPPREQERKKKRNRKSRAVKEQCNERYRAFNNQLFVRDLEKRHDERLGPLGVPASSVPLQSIAPQPLIIKMSLKILDGMIEETVTRAVNVLKVQSDSLPHDIQLVKLVSRLQIAAKVYYAHCAASVETDQRSRRFHKFVSEELPDNLESVTTYIDQIGMGIYEGQIIIPEIDSIDVSLLTSETPLELPSDFPAHHVATEEIVEGEQLIVGFPDINLAAGVGLAGIDQEGRVQYSQQLIQRPFETLANVPPGMYVTHFYGRNYEMLVQQYSAWIGRCKKRIANKVRCVNIRQGIGTVAQLVGSDNNSDRLGEVDAWCIRAVSDHVMTVGAGMQLGTHRSRLDEIRFAVTRKRVNRSRFISQLVDLLL